ncbi:2-succinyl-6-hydroxy-2,4-cyclohexadiene-1-carboxylate synthase [Candidatus Poriferisocius sp.]|uniref:2-succinyl-6-hydroxy-2, 4-cyclohexadiene-1-carboxylate synthase n=1 Tax=Candidatus Poriferisocius sp. TaxID=3101276 RepID=UPI003B017071
MSETTTVVLHGFTGSASAMVPLTSRLPQPVLAVDLPGHGSGPISDDPADYTMAAAVAAVVTAVTDRERFALVGYSMGGRVALHLAVAHPDRVAALAVIGARGGIDDPVERARRIAADEALAAQIETRGIEWFTDHWGDLPLFASQRHRLPAAQRAALRAQRLACDPGGLARSLRGMGAGAVDPIGGRLGELSMPCTLIAGADDTKFAAIARAMAAVIPRADVYLVPDAGHAAHLEAPDATATAVAAVTQAGFAPRVPLA